MNIPQILESTHDDPVLIVLDNIHPTTIPYFTNEKKIGKFYDLLNRKHTHIMATLFTDDSTTGLNSIIKQTDTLLTRGSNITEVGSLSPIHATQRIVYGHLQRAGGHPPSTSVGDRAALESLAHFTKGSPSVIGVITSKGMSKKYPEPLSAFAQRVTEDENNALQNEMFLQSKYLADCDAIAKLIDLCGLNSCEELFLYCLCVFHSAPIQECVLEGLACVILQSRDQTTSQHKEVSHTTICQKLADFNLLQWYPHPVVLRPATHVSYKVKETSMCYCVSPAVAMALWGHKMDDTDKVIALGIVYRVLEAVYPKRRALSPSDLQHLLGLVRVALETFDCNCSLIGAECYELFYGLLFRFEAACSVNVSIGQWLPR